MTALLVATGQADWPGEGRWIHVRAHPRPGYHPSPWGPGVGLGDRGLSLTMNRMGESRPQAAARHAARFTTFDVPRPHQPSRLTFTAGVYVPTYTV